MIDSQAWLALSEVPRAGLDLGALMAAAPFLALSPAGDGHPVVVLPGYLANDDSTWILRTYLGRLGYEAHPWGQDRNLGVTAMGGYESLVNHVLRIHRTTGKKVSLVGWSLGGVHALAVAHRAEYAVRSIITLGSPLIPPKADGSDQTTLGRAVAGSMRGAQGAMTKNLTKGMQQAMPGDSLATLSKGIEQGMEQTLGKEMTENLGKQARQMAQQTAVAWSNALLKLSPKLPITSIYSRTDGVVPHTRSLLEEGKRRENIEVVSSHLGLGVNPTVLFAIADRLAQKEGKFKKFSKGGMRSLLYP